MLYIYRDANNKACARILVQYTLALGFFRHRDVLFDYFPAGFDFLLHVRLTT